MEGSIFFYEARRHPVVYNRGTLTIADIHHTTDRFPNLAGVMIERGLLTDPALGREYRGGRKLSPEEQCEKLKALHTAAFLHYEEQTQGGGM